MRDMRTVVLDQRQMSDVLADINEYLHPGTPRWYANRGIPLRRGYLFHGPPGTGKTSLSFALAGVFGLDIHVISLQEPTLTEEDLGSLFGALPRRCVVLLEDIDSAGLQRTAAEERQRRQQQQQQQQQQQLETVAERARGEGVHGSNTAAASSSSPSAGASTSTIKENGVGETKTCCSSTPAARTTTTTTAATAANDWKVSDLAKALRKEGNSDEKKGISLSGLLNAIDGVASHEGRVLIMTTNTPESLDGALIRPGRVDLQVEFTNATTRQAEELFIRMYEADRRDGRAGTAGAVAKVSTSTPSSSSSSSPCCSLAEKPQHLAVEKNGHTIAPPPATAAAAAAADLLDIPEEELPSIAKQFAKKIPDGQFSPAEIQGYLLKRKKHPLRALKEADEWVGALMQQKASKSKIIKVQ